MIIFDAHTCPLILYMSKIWYVWIVYESIWLRYVMYVLWYVNDMITLTLWYVQWYVWGRIWEECDKRNVMIWFIYDWYNNMVRLHIEKYMIRIDW